jgi:putative oxidoreductase
MKLGSAQELLPWAPLALRLSLGVIFLAHGAQQLFGIWDGPGLPEPIGISKAAGRIPAYLTLVSAGTKFIGGIAVAVGLLTRLAALGLSLDTVAWILKVHLVNGFFLNWSMMPGKGHGYEYNLALLAMSISLLVSGPGKLALDHVLGFEED